jgi:hypothetical protein
MSGTAAMSHRKRFRNIDRRGTNTGPFRVRRGRAFAVKTTTRVPLAPTKVSALAGSLSAIITWVGGPFAATYTVEKSPDGSTAWTVVSSTIKASLPETGQAFTVTGLVASVAQFFRVTGVNAAGTGAVSANASATPTA